MFRPSGTVLPGTMQSHSQTPPALSVKHLTYHLPEPAVNVPTMRASAAGAISEALPASSGAVPPCESCLTIESPQKPYLPHVGSGFGASI